MSDLVDVAELRAWLEEGYASSVRTAYLILGNRLYGPGSSVIPSPRTRVSSRGSTASS
jgi:hypothetical protein